MNSGLRKLFNFVKMQNVFLKQMKNSQPLPPQLMPSMVTPKKPQGQKESTITEMLPNAMLLLVK